MNLTNLNKGLHLILGPAWSGKTNFAVKELAHEVSVQWLGTGQLKDSKLNQHINNLKSTRPKTWTSIDCPETLIEILAANSALSQLQVIDSASQWLVNQMVSHSHKYDSSQLEIFASEQTEILLESLLFQAKFKPIVLISAEMGAAPPPQESLSYEIRKYVGLLNQKLAAVSSTVIFVTAGIGNNIKKSQYSISNQNLK